MVESIRVTEDLGTKAADAEEVESSHGENPETTSGVGGVDQLVGHIIHFANAVEQCKRKNQNCFRCGCPDHLVRD